MLNCFWIKSPIKENYSGALSFVKNIKLNGLVKSAYLLVSAVGLYEALINDQKVGDRGFTPGFTSYDKRGIQYQ